MPAVEGATADVKRLLLPRGKDVIERSDRPPGPPQRQERGDHRSVRVGAIVLEVDRGGGAVVLADCVDRGRVAVAAEVLLDDRLVQRPRGLRLAGEVPAEEELRVGADHPFRQVVGLDQEEPPEVSGRELLVGPLVHRRGRRDVEECEALDRVRVIERHAVGDPRPAVVPHHGEASEAQAPHHLHLVEGHGPLGVGAVVPTAGRLRGVAVAAQVRRDDRVAGLAEARRDLVPGDVRLGVAVEQQHRRSGAGDGDPDPRAARLHVLLDEPRHDGRRPRLRVAVHAHHVPRRLRPRGHDAVAQTTRSVSDTGSAIASMAGGWLFRG